MTLERRNSRKGLSCIYSIIMVGFVLRAPWPRNLVCAERNGFCKLTELVLPLLEAELRPFVGLIEMFFL